MGKNLYILSALNSLCCIVLIVYQVEPFLEATDYVSIYRRKQYVIETSKIIVYIAGLVAYMTLGCYKSCFDCVRTNFALKFCGISLILSSFVLYDGVTRGIYHYIAYAVLNFICMIIIYKEILHEWEEEMRRHQYIDEDANNYKKIESENHYIVDISESKKKEAEIV